MKCWKDNDLLFKIQKDHHKIKFSSLKKFYKTSGLYLIKNLISREKKEAKLKMKE